MARQSSDREDLMAEAIALSPRVSLHLTDFVTDIVAGRGNDGRWSVFFGGDPVYHFDPHNRLRRAFVGGYLYRSQGTTLARLTRQETASATVLLRHDLDTSELASFLENMRFVLALLAEGLKLRTATLQQSIPPDADFLPELASRLDVVLNSESLLAPPLKK